MLQLCNFCNNWVPLNVSSVAFFTCLPILENHLKCFFSRSIWRSTAAGPLRASSEASTRSWTWCWTRRSSSPRAEIEPSSGWSSSEATPSSCSKPKTGFDRVLFFFPFRLKPTFLNLFWYKLFWLLLRINKCGKKKLGPPVQLVYLHFYRRKSSAFKGKLKKWGKFMAQHP